MSFKTYVVIVTYNAMPWLDKCLSSIDRTLYKTVVVDNNSKDETTDVIKSKYPHVKLFEEEENLGFGQGNNKGISYALNNGAEHVFLLNQDAYLKGDCLRKLVNLQVENPEYGILSPIHTNAESNKLDRNFAKYVGYDNNNFFYSDFVLGSELKSVYEVPFINAAGWLLSKNCLMNVGGFDPMFFHYGEDENYCQRVSFHKFKIGVVPNVFMVHDREYREKEVFKLFSEKYFYKQDIRMKAFYGNINEYEADRILKYKETVKKQLMIAFLKGKITHARGFKKLLKVIDKVHIEIEKSHHIVKTKFPAYLDLS
ncbi:hypothetical protein BST97_00095 [Nonlabens spongiae]|uniref:Glycosyltransferase 2-like domain-containing protein n=1 Tax=Nonlabens spongiae TaxID=331648 RepID=A0A1W6MGC8_9FLAO|nr:glycosyltransferase family 2 protein [Nonlabens spongiae]ARN76529.1 hypothetical protein BST97_00095 [Nonlabens spongiae]